MKKYNIINHLYNKKFSLFNEFSLPKLTFYHGSIKKYDEILPTAFSAGNRLRNPSWAVFMFRQKDLAINYAISYAVGVTAQENNMVTPSGWIEKDGLMHYKMICVYRSDYYEKLKNLVIGKKVYVYTLKVPLDSNLSIIGTTSSLPEYTYSGKPETIKREEIIINEELFENMYIKVSPDKLEDIKKARRHRKNIVGPWMDLFIDDFEREKKRKYIIKRIENKTIKPGDDLSFMKNMIDDDYIIIEN